LRVTKPRARRYPFNATIELTDLDSEVQVRGQTSNLSLFGCQANILNQLAVGSRIRIRISHLGSVFTALGRVAYVGAKGDMGVHFTSIEQTNQLILEEWVAGIRDSGHSSSNTHVRAKNR
jgi:hypothetical protein